MQATKVRARLEEYYTAQGASDPVIIELPKGSYKPTFQIRTLQSNAAKPKWKIAALILLAAAGTTAYYFGRTVPPVSPSVAVFPFVDLSQAKDQQHIVDTVTDNIISFSVEAACASRIKRREADPFGAASCATNFNATVRPNTRSRPL